MRNLFFLCIAFASWNTICAQTQPNIVFIICDDLNDYVQGFSGQPQVETPNISALAAQGTVFENAYCAGPLCAPARTSLMMGKGPEYTDIYINGSFDCENFRNNFEPGKYVLTLPEYLKDSGNYFTYNISKVFHCDAGLPDYDETTSDVCEKELSWNKFITIGNDDTINDAGQAAEEGLDEIKWAKIDSALVTYMADYVMMDSAGKFLREYNTNPSAFCDKPFFLGLGFRRPHSNLYIPEQYFKEDYITDIYAEPWDYNYNVPYNVFPYNGLVMPPNPDPPYNDYYTITPLGREQIALAPYNEFDDYPDSLDFFPLIEDGLTDEEREDILTEAKRANAILAYLAAIKFVDEQFGRFMDSLAAYPEIYNNTIIVFTSDHGYSWGEKKHYGKASMYETDIRIPLFVTDLRNLQPQVSKRTVSALDIFPTACDWAGIEYPNFPDGTPYLDGHSLSPMLINADTTWERPVLSQVKNSFDGLVCFPQNSVRNERFHFIQYTSNGTGGDCDETTAIKQTELYEIGVNRETDPFEWNNLADSAGYEDLVDYMETFLPDGNNYIKKLHDVVITVAETDCFAGYDDTIHLSAQLFSENGNLITDADSLSNYTFTWRNSLTNATFSGTSYDFPVSNIPVDEYDAAEKIIFYLNVRRDLPFELAAFELQYVYINPANTPGAAYDLTADSATLTVTINDYTISGDYTTIDWDFGDGFISHDFLPAQHTYTAPGPYIFTNTVHYGNGCTLVQTDTLFDFDTTVIVQDAAEHFIAIYPNPSAGNLTVQLVDGKGDVRLAVTNNTGQLVYSEEKQLSGNSFNLDITTLPAGTYILYLLADDLAYAAQVVIVK